MATLDETLIGRVLKNDYSSLKEDFSKIIEKKLDDKVMEKVIKIRESLSGTPTEEEETQEEA